MRAGTYEGDSDKYGFISKENEFGNHPVRAMGGIHFKPNPKGLDFLGVAEEFMVHSLGEIISGYAPCAVSWWIVDSFRVDRVQSQRLRRC